MGNTKLRADASFVIPPPPARFRTTQIDNTFDPTLSQKLLQKANIGLGRAGDLARCDPVEIIENFQRRAHRSRVLHLNRRRGNVTTLRAVAVVHIAMARNWTYLTRPE